MQRKTNNLVEEVIPRQVCYRPPVTITSIPPNPALKKGSSLHQNIPVMEKNC
jgi:hypothetical protein